MHHRRHRYVIAYLFGSLAATACHAGESPDEQSHAKKTAIVVETDLGDVHCTLFDDRAPNAVALITQLATGKRSFRTSDGAWRKGRYYDGLHFFRRVAGVMIQTGCPRNDGTGHPGFRIPAELHDDDVTLLQKAGALVMARYRTPPNREDPNPPPPDQVIGSQFAITLRPMAHLAGTLPVIGRCANLDVVQKLSTMTAAPILRHLRVEKLEPAD